MLKLSQTQMISLGKRAQHEWPEEPRITDVEKAMAFVSMFPEPTVERKEDIGVVVLVEEYPEDFSKVSIFSDEEFVEYVNNVFGGILNSLRTGAAEYASMIEELYDRFGIEDLDDLDQGGEEWEDVVERADTKVIQELARRFT